MKLKRVPLRKCTGCKEMKEKNRLVRIVKISDGTFRLDPTLKLAGRGAYVCNDTNCFEQSQKKKGFERSFKARVPQEIYENLKISIIGGG